MFFFSKPKMSAVINNSVEAMEVEEFFDCVERPQDHLEAPHEETYRTVEVEFYCDNPHLDCPPDLAPEVCWRTVMRIYEGTPPERYNEWHRAFGAFVNAERTRVESPRSYEEDWSAILRRCDSFARNRINDDDDRDTADLNDYDSSESDYYDTDDNGDYFLSDSSSESDDPPSYEEATFQSGDDHTVAVENVLCRAKHLFLASKTRLAVLNNIRRQQLERTIVHDPQAWETVDKLIDAQLEHHLRICELLSRLMVEEMHRDFILDTLVGANSVEHIDMQREIDDLERHITIMGYHQFGLELNVKHSIDVSAISGIKELISNMIGSFAPVFFEKVMLIVSNMYLLTQVMDDPIGIAAVVTSLCSGLGLVHGAVDLLCGVLNAFVGKIRNPEHQAPNFSEVWRTALIYVGTFLFCVLFVFVVHKLPGKHTIDELLMRLRNLSGVLITMKILVDFGRRVLTTCADYLHECIYGRPRVDESGMAKINAWMDEVSGITNMQFYDRLKTDDSAIALVNRLFQEGLEHSRMMDAIHLPMSDRGAFAQHFLTVRNLMKLAQESGAGKQYMRMEPALIQFWGNSGVGKSMLINFLNAVVAKKVYNASTVDEVNRLVYSRKTGQEFWDGYCKQKIVNYDDFGALKDGEANPNAEFLEMIHLQNNAPYPLHMASLLEKANTYFEAECVFLTSNKEHYNTPSLTCAPALYRRFDHVFEVRVAQPYAKVTKLAGQDNISLDRSKIDATSPQSMQQAWVFVKHENGQETFFDFAEVAKMVYDTVIENKARFNNIKDVMATFLAEFQAGDEAGPSDEGMYRGQIVPGFPFRCDAEAQAHLTKAFDRRVLLERGFNDAIGLNFLLTPLRYWQSRRTFVDYDSGEWFGFEMTLPDDPVNETLVLPFVYRNWANLSSTSSRVPEELEFAHIIARRAAFSYVDETEQQRAYARAFMLAYSVQVVQQGADGDVVSVEIDWPVVGAGLDFVLYRAENSAFTTRMKERISQSAWVYACRSSCNTMNLNTELTREELDTGFKVAFIFMSGVGALLALKLGKKLFRLIKRVIKKVRSLWLDDDEDDDFLDLDADVESGTTVTKGAVIKMKRESGQTVTKGAPVKAKSESETHLRDQWQAAMQEASVVPNKITGVAQALLDQNGGALLARISMQNQYKLETLSNGKWRHLVTVTFLEGRRAVTVAHVSFLLEETFRLRNFRYPDGIEFRVDECVFGLPDPSHPIYGKRDVMIIEFPNRMIQHANIVKHIAQANDFKMYSEVKKVALVGYSLESVLAGHVYYSTQAISIDGEIQITSVDSKVYSYTGAFGYDIETRKGDCGSILISLCKEHIHKIIGIHFGGTTDRRAPGLAAPFSIGFYEHLCRNGTEQISLPELDANIDVVMESGCETVTNEYDPTIVVPREFTSITPPTILKGVLVHGSIADGPNQPGTSNIFKSPVHGMIREPCTKPARLRPFTKDGVRYDPKEMARQKVLITPVPLDQDLLEECCGDVLDMLGTRKDTRGRVLTVEEAIKGVPNDPWIEPLERNSSPGFPWIKEKCNGKRGKATWLGEDEQWIVDHPDLMKALNHRLYEARNGRRTPTIWVDTLKDERRPLEKVAAGKTRLFSVGPLDYNILFRQFFGDFLASVMENRIAVESCVGINPYSREWHLLALRLNRFNNVLAGDFTNYDGTLHASILWAICDLINDWYASSEEDSRVRRVLWADIVHSVHLTDSFVGGALQSVLYVWNQSQPSGNPGTVIINSIYNSIACRMAFLLAALELRPECADLGFFHRNVVIANYGDDNIWSCSNETSTWLTMEVLTEAFAKFGMKYTDELKREGGSYRRLDEITFLKRRFEWDSTQKRYLAPLSLDTVLEMPMWVHGKRDTHSLTAQNLETAAYELSLHGEKVFNEWMPVLRKASIEANLTVRPIFLPYKGYMRKELLKYVAQDPTFDNLHYRLYGTPRMMDVQHNENQQSKGDSSQIAGPGITGEAQSVSRIGTYVRAIGQLVVPFIGERQHDHQSGVKFVTFYGGLQSGNATQGAFGGAQEREVEQIVTFKDVGDVVEDSVPQPLTAIADVMNRESRSHSVIDFLERPYRLTQFQWPVAAPALTELAYLDIPEVWKAKNAVREKLHGFQLYRYDSVSVRVQVNAQPFQQGILLLYAVPFEANYPQVAGATLSQTASLQGITGFPHAMINLACNQSAILSLPWVHINEQMTTRETSNHYRIHIVVYAPLLGGDDIGVTTWIKMEGVDPQVPTGVDIPMEAYFQAGEEPSMTLSAPGSGNSGGSEQTANGGTTFVDGTKKLSGAISREIARNGVNKMTKEVAAAKSSDGTVSKVLSAASMVSSVAAFVPPLTAIAAPLAAVTGLGASVAKIFGWSKPLQDSTTQPVVMKPARMMNSACGADESKKWAMSQLTGLSVEPLFGTSMDEMSLRALTTRPTYLHRFQWSVGDLQGALLNQFPAQPMGLELNPDLNAYASPMLSYVTSFFSGWRGSLEYIFHFSKTASMHSGRLAIEVVPGTLSKVDPVVGSSTFLPYDENLVYREIIDLAEMSSYTLRVPFVASKPWLPTFWENPWAVEIAYNDAPGESILSCFSSVNVKVLNELRRPNTLCSDTIDVIVEIKAGPDFELAYPKESPFYPLRLSNGPQPTPPVKATFQSFMDEAAGASNGENLFPGLQVKGGAWENTVGETVDSIKALVNRFAIRNLCNGNEVFTPQGGDWASNTKDATQSATKLSGSSGCSAYDMFAPLYAFQRGGWRYKISPAKIPSSDDTLGRSWAPSFEPYNLAWSNDAAFNWDVGFRRPGRTPRGVMTLPFAMEVEGIIEYERPWFGMRGVVDRSPFLTNKVTVADCFHVQTEDHSSYWVWTAPAEDFQFGFIVGTPLVRRYSST